MLSEWLQRGQKVSDATAIFAIPATEAPRNSKIARVAIASPERSGDERLIRNWLASIEETDQETINEVIDAVRRSPDARRYFLLRAGGLL